MDILRISTEPLYHRELNPHMPKLTNLLSGNDTMTHRILNPSPNACVRLIQNCIKL